MSSALCKGDTLLYRPHGPFGLLISVKTWHAVSHIEVYVGDGESVASRDGIGVGKYPVRGDYGWILRPLPSTVFDLPAALKWFETVKGQGYDWLGLLRFSWRNDFVPTKFTSNRMFCSEFATRFYRAGGFDPFPREDADAVAPFQFLYNPLFTVV